MQYWHKSFIVIIPVQKLCQGTLINILHTNPFFQKRKLSLNVKTKNKSWQSSLTQWSLLWFFYYYKIAAEACCVQALLTYYLLQSFYCSQSQAFFLRIFREIFGHKFSLRQKRQNLLVIHALSFNLYYLQPLVAHTGALIIKTL